LGILFILCIISAVSFASEEPIKLTLADSTAPVGLRGNGVKLFLEEVEKHTNGKVQIDVYWGESLLKAKEILKGVKEGVVDMGFINPNYYPKQLLVNGSFAIYPRGPKKFSNVIKLWKRCFEEIPEFNQELQLMNQKTIYINGVLPYAVVSTKPFTSFEDFRGKRIRSSSRWTLDMLEGAGAIPVSVPWGDCYMALQTGTIEGVITNIDGEHRTKLDEAAPNIFTIREMWSSTPMLYTINIDKWNSLPPDIQSQLLEAGRSASLRFSEIHNAEWGRVVNEQKELGYTIASASPEDIEKWMAMPVIDRVKEEWSKEAKEKGIENAKQIVDQISKIIDEVIENEKLE